MSVTMVRVVTLEARPRISRQAVHSHFYHAIYVVLFRKRKEKEKKAGLPVPESF